MTDIEYINKYYKGNKEDAIKELEKGIPVQYIVGEVDFSGYIFKVNKNVLIPRFETEELVHYSIDLANEYLKDQKLNVLDIGTGSGCIAITIKKEIPESNVRAIDISTDALEVAKENAKLNNAEIEFTKSDIFENISGKYNLIISNPPYISTKEEIQEIVKNNEPHLALYAGEEGLDVYKRILKDINSYIQDKYIVAFEIGYKQKESIVELIKQYLDGVDIITKEDMYGRDRFIFIIKE